MDLALSGRKVLVTGSQRGTGLTIAEHFQAAGATVIIHGHDQASLANFGASFTDRVVGELWTDAGCQSVIQQINEQHQDLDVLVNNYGIASRGDWLSSSSKDWRDAYEHNVLSASRISQGLLPLLKQSTQGRIINLGTVGSTRPNPQMPHYYAAKGALANLTVSLAKALSGSKVTVNLVSPGLIRTPEVEANFLSIATKKGWGNTFAEAEAAITQHYFDNPLGRMATRAEVADLVVFLASARAGFINAQNIGIDGGALGLV